MTTALYIFAIILFITLCVVLCFVILIQESKSTGLGASFGGDSGDSLFGTSTADVLKQITGWLAFTFLLSCVILSIWTTAMSHTATSSGPIIEQTE